MYHHGNVMLSAAKHLVLRPFASLRVTHKGANLVWFDLGKDVEARAEAAEVLRINSNFSLELYRERAPIKDPATLERHIAALRKAGLK
jgi:hypothetical protein